MLPMSGHGDGAIFFRDGQVVCAESNRTRTPLRRDVGLAALGLAPVQARPLSTSTGLAVVAKLDRVVGMLALTEPTIDAITELLSSESRYAKFRQSDAPPAAAQTGPMSIELVLTEVERRRQVLRQLAPVVSPDTPIVRQALLDSPSFQVSSSQWALLVRVGDGTTPRTLALGLSRSVFGTTIEVYRLLALGLLVVPGQPSALAGESAGRRPAEIMSFMRAITDAGGNDA